jgi:nicotinamide-nucleotide amidase
MKAIILSIGDELTLGQSVDTNSAWLSGRLTAAGVATRYHKTVADDQEAIVAAVREAAGQADLVLVTGGLGPTQDDLTRQALAAVMNRPLDMHPPSLERIRLFFERLGRDMPPTNRVQALVPRGAEVLENDWGTAPGIKARLGRATLYAFPGVPREMQPMFDRHVQPSLQRPGAAGLVTESLRVFGAGESTVAEKLGDLMRRDRNPLVGTTVSGGIVTVRLRSQFLTREIALRQLERTAQEVRERLGPLVFGRGTDTLPEVVGRLAAERGVRVATAESCTGGLLAKLLTDNPGSSAYFLGGWVTYANAMKTRELGVPESLLDGHGAVSEAVAVAMAEGAARRSGAEYALALTGVAGPEGGSEEKPVGLVWIALAHRRPDGLGARAECHRFPGDRESVRDRAAKTALNLLRLELAR